MVALLSAPRLLVWRRCHVDACSLRILFTGKTLAATEKAIGLPEAVREPDSLEVPSRVGDAPIHQGLGDGIPHAYLSECCHSVYETG